MKRALALILALTLALALPGCGTAAADYTVLTADPVSAAYDGSTEPAQTALAGFGLDLLRGTRDQTGEPALVSPLSAALALSMAANGADGDTLAQFEAVLSGGAGLDALNALCQELTADYESLGGSTECSIANSLWVDPEGMIREDFIGRCGGIFDAQVIQAQLSDPGIVPALNGWVSDHTGGMIPEIVSEPFSEEAAALLVNALYLKNTWAAEFDPNQTMERTFTHGDGSEERMDFLRHFDRSLPYLETADSVGALLPYDDGRLAFFALMPRLYPDSPDFEAWLAGLDGAELGRLVRDSRDRADFFLRLSLPKFESEWKGELKDVLTALGLELAFDDTGLADFSLLGDNPYGYYLSQVIHATKLEVNEEGTRAAAATVVEAPAGSAAPLEEPQGIELDFDRPFLYGIVDLENGVPLFLGTFE